jgi:hypothetical protein
MKAKFTSVSILGIVLSLGLSISAFAQADSDIDQHQVTVVIPTLALLDIETSGSKNISASFIAPTEATTPRCGSITLPSKPEAKPREWMWKQVRW